MTVMLHPAKTRICTALKLDFQQKVQNSSVIPLTKFRDPLLKTHSLVCRIFQRRLYLPSLFLPIQ